VKQQTGISRRLGSRATARTFAPRSAGPERAATNTNEHADLRRLTLELSGHIIREAIDWSA
jgi:hypothetical protein